MTTLSRLFVATFLLLLAANASAQTGPTINSISPADVYVGSAPVTVTVHRHGLRIRRRSMPGVRIRLLLPADPVRQHY
jgi:hypothetical protein